LPVESDHCGRSIDSRVHHPCCERWKDYLRLFSKEVSLPKPSSNLERILPVYIRIKIIQVTEEVRHWLLVNAIKARNVEAAFNLPKLVNNLVIDCKKDEILILAY